MSNVIICNRTTAQILNFFVKVDNNNGYSATEHVGIREGISSIDERTYTILQQSKAFKMAVEQGTIIVNDSKLIAEYQQERAKKSGNVDQRSEIVKLSAENQKLKLEMEKTNREIESLKQLVTEATGKQPAKKNADTN